MKWRRKATRALTGRQRGGPADGRRGGRRWALGRPSTLNLIGREAQVDRFEQILGGNADVRATILLISGAAGTGKRTLLEMFRESAADRDAYCTSVCDLSRPRDLAELLEEVVAALDAPDGTFDGFERTLRRQREWAQGKKSWYSKAAETAEGTATEVNQVAPHWSTGGARLATGAIRNAVDWFDDAGRHRSITDEFVNGLRSLASADAPVVLLFNGLGGHQVDPVVRWLRTDLPARVADKPVSLVIAAESVTGMDEDLRSRGANVEIMALQPFSADETRAFIRKVHGIDPDSRLGRQIADESGDLPAWLGRLQSYFEEHGRPDSAEELSEDARAAATGGGAELFRRLEDSGQRRLALYASPLRWFNASLLEAVADVAGVVVDDASGPDAALRLIEMSTRPHWLGPRGSGWGFALDIQRRALVDELRRVDPEAYWAVHRHAEQYHRRRLAALDRKASGTLTEEAAPDDAAGGEPPALERRWRRFDDPEYVDTLAEWLYHLVAIAPDLGLRLMVEEAAESLLHLPDTAVARLTEIGPELGLSHDKILYLRELASVEGACVASRFEDAEEMLRRLRQMTEPSELAVASLAIAHGYVLWQCGRPANVALEAFACAERILSSVPSAMAPRVRAFNLTWLAWVSGRAGDVDAALEHLDMAVELAEAAADEFLVAEAIRSRALVLDEIGRDLESEVEPVLDDALERYRRIGRLKDVVFLLQTRANIRLRSSMPEKARVDLIDARDLSRQLGDANAEAETVVALVQLALWQGDQATADNLRDETIALRAADAHVRNALGNAYFATGFAKQAIELYTQALAIQPETVFLSNRGRARWAADDRPGALEDTEAAYHRALDFDLALELAGWYREMANEDGFASVSEHIASEALKLIATESEQQADAAPHRLPSRVSSVLRRVVPAIEPAAVERVLQEAATRYPDEVDEYVWLLRGAVDANPDAPELQFALGVALQSLHTTWSGVPWSDEAGEPLERAWRIEQERASTDNEDRRVRYALTCGEMMIHLRRWDVAREAVSDALAITPDDELALALERRLERTLKRRDSYEGGSVPPAPRAVIVTVAPDIRPLVDPAATSSRELFDRVLPDLRTTLTTATGALIPGVLFREDSALEEHHARITVHGVQAQELDLRSEYLVASAECELPDDLGSPTTTPWDGRPAVWVSEDQREVIADGGFMVWDRVGVLLGALVALLAARRTSFVGVEQVAFRLEEAGLGGHVSLDLSALTATVRRLVERDVVVADLQTIVAALDARGDRQLDQIIDDLAATLPRVSEGPRPERYAQGGTSFLPESSATIVARVSRELALPPDVATTLRATAATIAEALGLPEPTVEVQHATYLPPERYEILVADAVRLAGSFTVSPRRWLADHPVAGPGGRCASSVAIDPAADNLEPEVHLVRGLEEVLSHDPGLLLMTPQGRTWRRELLADTDLSDADAVDTAMTVLQDLASERVPIGSRARVTQALASAFWDVHPGQAGPEAPGFVTGHRQVDRAIPDNFAFGLRDVMEIRSSGTIARVAVTLHLTHSQPAELRVRLIAPSGASVVVHDREWMVSDRLELNSDEDQRLQGLVGGPAAGTWQLHVQDLEADDVGTLDWWSLELLMAEDGDEPVLAQRPTRPLGRADWPWRCVATKRIATELRPYEVVLNVAPDGVLGGSTPELDDQLKAMLVEHAPGLGFPTQALRVSAGALAADDYVIVINGLPRAHGRVTQHENPDDAVRFIGQHLAACVREAMRELVDLTWTSGFLDRGEANWPRLIDAVRDVVPPEILAFVFGSVAEDGILDFDEPLLDAVLDYVACVPSAVSRDTAAVQDDEPTLSPYALVQHVRLALSERLVLCAAGDASVAIELDGELEDRLRSAIRGDSDSDGREIYASPDAALVLRELDLAVSSRAAAREVVVVTATDLRRHVQRLIGAQFPMIPVIARDELTSLQLPTVARLPNGLADAPYSVTRVPDAGGEGGADGNGGNGVGSPEEHMAPGDS